MDTATITTSNAPYISQRSKPSVNLMSRTEAKNLLGEYAFSLIDEARKSGKDLDEVLERLDAENINTEDFEDVAFGLLMEEGLTGEYISEEEFFKLLRQ